MEFKRGDPIVVVAGTFAGKKGKFIELAGKESGRVKLTRDKQESRTLRMTSIRPEGYETDEDEETVTISKDSYLSIIADLDELQQQLVEMKHRVKMMVAERKGNRKK